MSVVTNTAIISRVTKNVKSVLVANTGTGKTIIDPKQTKRDATKEPFYRTTEARRLVYYPHVLVGAYIASEDTLSLKGDSTRVIVVVNITVIADNNKDLDELIGMVNACMRMKRVSFKAYGMNRPKEWNLGVSPMTRTNNIIQRVASFRFIYYAIV